MQVCSPQLRCPDPRMLHVPLDVQVLVLKLMFLHACFTLRMFSAIQFVII